jgi:hypothetical protein
MLFFFFQKLGEKNPRVERKDGCYALGNVKRQSPTVFTLKYYYIFHILGCVIAAHPDVHGLAHLLTQFRIFSDFYTGSDLVKTGSVPVKQMLVKHHR